MTVEISSGRPKKIIEIAGKKHSGKTFLAMRIFDALSKKGYRIYKTSFASHLKRILRNVGVEKEKPSKVFYHFDIFFERLKREIFDLFDSYYNGDIMLFYEKRAMLSSLIISEDVLPKLKEGFNLYFKENKYEDGYRILAQTIGTEVFRAIDENFWVKALLKDLKQVGSSADFVIIDDYRFPNEDLSFYYGKRVLRILLKLDGQEEIDNHPSETMVDKVPYDIYVVRQGTIYTPSFGLILQKILA